MKFGNYLIGTFIARLNLGAKRRWRFIELELNPTYLKLLEILYIQGAIRSFHVQQDKILVYYKYYLHRIGIKLSLISKPSKRAQYSLQKLSVIYNNNNFSGFYIISTQKGIFTSNYCLLEGHLAGEVCFKVEV